LDNLPLSLCHLVCSYNQLSNLDNLPPNLISLDCSGNDNLTKLNNLPASLVHLDCRDCNNLEYDFTPTLERIRYYLSKLASH